MSRLTPTTSLPGSKPGRCRATEHGLPSVSPYSASGPTPASRPRSSAVTASRSSVSVIAYRPVRRADRLASRHRYNRPMAQIQAVIGGLAAAWVKALSERRLQGAAERLLPPSAAQKQEGGADPTGHPENMPPAVIANRTAVALGRHGGLTAPQRVRIQQ